MIGKSKQIEDKNKKRAVKSTAQKKSTMKTSTIEVMVNQMPVENEKSKIKNQSKKAKKAKPKKQVKPTKPIKEAKTKDRTDKSKMVKILVGIGLVVAAAIFLCTTPLFNVTSIEVVGNQAVSSEEIISLSQIKLNENMFKNITGIIKQNIKGNAYIEDVEVKRVLPNKMQITVKERPVKFMAKLLSNYAYINSQGYILEITEQTKEVPVLDGISTPEEEIIVGKRLNNDDLSKLEIALKIMSSCEENEMSRYVTCINVQNASEYTMNLAEKGITVHLGSSSNLETKMLYVKAMLQAEDGNEGDIFVNGDLNNGFQPFFRMKV